MCALVTGVQTCALPICRLSCHWRRPVPGTTQGRSADIGSFFEHLARNDDAHDFIGAFKNLVDAGVAYQALKGIVFKITVTAMDLLCVQANLKADRKSTRLNSSH